MLTEIAPKSNLPKMKEIRKRTLIAINTEKEPSEPGSAYARSRLLPINYCTNSTGVSILLIIFLASLNRDLSQESRCDVVITTKS
jgi:hypothetical protein